MILQCKLGIREQCCPPCKHSMKVNLSCFDYTSMCFHINSVYLFLRKPEIKIKNKKSVCMFVKCWNESNKDTSLSKILFNVKIKGSNQIRLPSAIRTAGNMYSPRWATACLLFWIFHGLLWYIESNTVKWENGVNRNIVTEHAEYFCYSKNDIFFHLCTLHKLPQSHFFPYWLIYFVSSKYW